jgi:hypothetical protein
VHCTANNDLSADALRKARSVGANELKFALIEDGRLGVPVGMGTLLLDSLCAQYRHYEGYRIIDRSGHVYMYHRGMCVDGNYYMELLNEADPRLTQVYRLEHRHKKRDLLKSPTPIEVRVSRQSPCTAWPRPLTSGLWFVWKAERFKKAFQALQDALRGAVIGSLLTTIPLDLDVKKPAFYAVYCGSVDAIVSSPALDTTITSLDTEIRAASFESTTRTEVEANLTKGMDYDAPTADVKKDVVTTEPCAQCMRSFTHAVLRRDFDGGLYCRECWEEEYGPSEQPDPECSDSKAAASVTQNAALSCDRTGHAFSKRRSRQIRTGEVGAQQFVVEEIFDCEFCGCVHRRPWALSPTAR